MNDLTTTTPAELLQIAVTQGADLAQLEKLLELQERWEAREAKKAYIVSMGKFRASVGNISKNRQGHNSKYADLGHTLDQIKDQLSANGLSHSWQTEQHENGLVTVTCTVTHTNGHSESTSIMANPDSSGSKNTIQAIGSTITYLQRYTLFSILGLASANDDNDGEKVVSAKEAAEIETLFTEIGGDKAKFLANFRVEEFNDIPLKQFARAMKMLEDKRAAK